MWKGLRLTFSHVWSTNRSAARRTKLSKLTFKWYCIIFTIKKYFFYSTIWISIWLLFFVIVLYLLVMRVCFSLQSERYQGSCDIFPWWCSSPLIEYMLLCRLNNMTSISSNPEVFECVCVCVFVCVCVCVCLCVCLCVSHLDFCQ